MEGYLYSETRFWFQLHVYRTGNWSWFPIRFKFLCFSGSILLVVMIRHFLEECIHDKPLQRTVLHCPLVMKYCPISTTCINPASIQNLLTLFSCESNSIRSSYRCSRRFWCDGIVILQRNFCLDFTWAQLIVPSVHQVALIDLDGIQILHTCLQLLRKDWADWQKQLCEKQSQLFDESAAKCIDSFPCPLLLRLPLDNGGVARKNWTPAFC